MKPRRESIDARRKALKGIAIALPFGTIPIVEIHSELPVGSKNASRRKLQMHEWTEERATQSRARLFVPIIPWDPLVSSLKPTSDIARCQGEARGEVRSRIAADGILRHHEGKP